jgi:hypothetical protein
MLHTAFEWVSNARISNARSSKNRLLVEHLFFATILLHQQPPHKRGFLRRSSRVYRAHTGWAQLGIPFFCSFQSLASNHCPLCLVIPDFVEPRSRTSRGKSLVPGHWGDLLVLSICPFALFSIPSCEQLHFQPRSSSPHIHHRGPLASRNKLLRVVLLL